MPVDPRTRTITWEDPAPGLAVFGTISGRAYLQGMIDRLYPSAPIGSLIGFERMTLGDGVCRVELLPREYHTNPMGTMHGGVVATLLDTVLGCALLTQLAAGEGHTTATLEIKFLRPVTLTTGCIIAEGRVIHRGRTLGTTEAKLTDSDGKLLATATSTLAMFPVPPTGAVFGRNGA